MTTEEKAKAYDKALKVIKECNPDENGFITIYPQEIFPELTESEDEKIRKDILSFAQSMLKLNIEKTQKDRFESWVTWLENQKGKDSLIKELGEYKAKYIQETIGEKLNEISNTQESEDKREKSCERVASYENGWKDAVDKALTWIGYNNNNGGCVFVGWKEDFKKFMRESEDEKIRKELITWLKNSEGQTLPIDKYNAAIVWLEKQGKQKQESEVYELGIKEGIRIKNKEWLEKQKEDRFVIDECNDEIMRNAAIDACKYMVDNFENSTKQYEDAIAWLKKQGKDDSDELYKKMFSAYDSQVRVSEESEDEKIRKAIIGYIDHGQHYGVSNTDMITWLERQKPMEWSKDDEQIKNQLIDICTKLGGVIPNVPNQFELIRWLQVIKRKIKEYGKYKN